MTVEIEPFRPEHRSRFAELNREWLERYNLMEPPDEEQLADPETHFIQAGGQIFIALYEGNVVGTCAVAPRGAEELELAKLAVSSAFRGQGIARRLVERCIAYARQRRVARLILVSNSQLQAALRLYESFGFRHAAVPDVKEYETADVYMVLNLDTD